MQPQMAFRQFSSDENRRTYDLAPECVVHLCLVIGEKGENGEKPTSQILPRSMIVAYFD